MLVANPGHTPYSFASNKISTNNKTKTTLNSNQSTSNDCNSVNSTSLKSSSSSVTAIASTSSTKSSGFDIIKSNSSKYNDVISTISVRINRGTELIKQTVNKALFSKIQPSFGSLLTVPPTSIHRSPDRNTKSTDSLKSEMCHFKPIRTVPMTPSKKTKIIIRTPKARRIQKPDFPRFIPIKSAISLLKPSSQKSAFYLVKRLKNLNETTTTSTIVSTTKKSDTGIRNHSNETKSSSLNRENHFNIPTNSISNTVTRLKRRRTESISSIREDDTKKICLDNKTKQQQAKASFPPKNHNSKPNGLIIENGQRRSVRIHNKKIENDKSYNLNTTMNGNKSSSASSSSTENKNKSRNKKEQNVDEKKDEPVVIEMRRSQRNAVKKSGNCFNSDNNIDKTQKIISNNKSDKNNTKNQRKSKLPQKDEQQTIKSSSKRKSGQKQTNLNSIECVHNLRPRIQKSKNCNF